MLHFFRVSKILTTCSLIIIFSPPRKRSEDNGNHNHNNTVSSLANDMGPIPDSLMVPFAHEKHQHEDADDQDDFVGGIGGTMGAITLEDELLQLDNKFNNKVNNNKHNNKHNSNKHADLKTKENEKFP